MNKIKSCGGCKAYTYPDSYPCTLEYPCDLGFKTIKIEKEIIGNWETTGDGQGKCWMSVTHRPDEICPKPRTLHKLVIAYRNGRTK